MLDPKLEKRQLVDAAIMLDIREDMYGPVGKIIEKLIELKAEFEAKGYVDLTIDEDGSFAYPYLNGKRLETDEEYEKRIAHLTKMAERAALQAAKTEAAERRLYYKLKKKYGKNEKNE